MDLVRDFETHKRRYLRKKHQNTQKSERERQNRIRIFLQYAENKGVKSIKDINKNVYADFVREYLSEKSLSTRQKYAYVLRGFFTMAHLNIAPNPKKSINRLKEKKLQKILKILDLNSITDKQKNEILKIL